MIPPGDGTGRRLISTLAGVVRLSDSAGNLFDTAANPDFSIATLYSRQVGTTAIAVHPGFAATGKIYLVAGEATGGALPETYALGFRNRYRMNFERGTGRSCVGEVGGRGADEINLVPGAERKVHL